MAPNNPAIMTMKMCRLSWPVFDYKVAVTRNQKSKFPRPLEEVTPEFNMLLEQHHLDLYVQYILNEYFPFVLAQGQAGEKGGLDPKEVDRLTKLIESGDWDAQPPYIPIKAVPEKTKELAPEAVAMLKVKGNRGVDIVQMARVRDEQELAVPDPKVLTFPILRPIHETVHNLYGGAYVAATLNHYAYISGKLPGFSASASTCVFMENGDRFGGGIDVDEDAIFLDD